MSADTPALVENPGDVLIVGASASGLLTAESLRRKGYGGYLTVIGDEVHPPYDRPPLSKQVLSGDWEPTRSHLRTADLLAAVDAEFVLGERVTGLDLAARSVRTAAGRSLGAEAIVIATGVTPRTFSWHEGVPGVHVLRTLEDAAALRADLLAGSRLVVVGEGVLGSEIAATARTLGLDVTMTGPLASPMLTQVGPLVSQKLADLHLARGVRLRLGAAVIGLESGSDRVSGVRLATGEVLAADVVVVAAGAVPATGWLEDSGLVLGDGVVCDRWCRASDGVYAVGDVARWDHPGFGSLRLENRTNATDQAAHVAATILGGTEPYAPTPYFWSDQYDVKVQVFGSVATDAAADVVDGDLESGRFVVRYARAGEVVAVLGWNMPKQARLASRSIGLPAELPVA